MEPSYRRFENFQFSAKYTVVVLHGELIVPSYERNQVLEVRPVINWDKGKAVTFLLESLGEPLLSVFASVVEC